jgi:uncharacterized membrane protein YkoI
MKGKLKGILIAMAAIAAMAAGGAAVAGAAGGGDDDATETAITGPSLERASAAALAETGRGKVTGTEVDDEEGAYEVEVTRPDGSQVDVHLDKSFEVLSSADDNDSSGEKDGPGDD